MVAFEHCKVLREHGYDVTIINDDIDERNGVNSVELNFQYYRVESIFLQDALIKLLRLCGLPLNS